ncbi:MAG: aminopeptidase [Clostridiales bacterium]|nr:aminopeptidase [Clostridiales bacterium]
MYSTEILTKYADLVLKIGVNLQKNQGLEIACPVENAYIAEIFAKRAYLHGAKIVKIRWSCESVDKINFENASVDALKEVPKWFVDSKNYLVENNFCYIAIDSDDPFAFKDIPAEKLFAVQKAKSKALKKFSDSVMSNGIRWCVVSLPSKGWAEKVFPNDADPQNKLFAEIIKTMRLNSNDPVKEWQAHIFKLESRAEFLNANRFKYLHFTNSLGTDIKVGLADNHKWLSAKELAKDGVGFVANIPTEEVFTAPHKDRIDGIVYSALPLSYNGQVIDEFCFKFRKGKIVEFSAKKGYGTLKELINTDKGTLSLGEVALIGKNSPIAKSQILFYNTLFDENASCHLALGKGYPTTVDNGEKLSVKELKSLGVNDSVEHVDFMIGTPDLNVHGIKEDGSSILIFKDGEWVI